MPKKKAKSKKPTETKMRKNQKNLSNKEAVFAQLNEWAHDGTKESLEKMENFMITEKDNELRGYANFAYGEAQYFYYAPRNKKEEKEFELARMICKEDNYLWKLINEANKTEYQIDKLEIEEVVFKKLMKKQTPEKKKAWQYRFVGDILGLKSRLHALQEDIEYQSAWLKEAKSMVTTKRYQNIPNYVFEHMQVDFDNGAYWTDTLNDFDLDCEYENDDCTTCPYCGSNDTEEHYNEIHPIGNYEEFNVEDIPF